MNVDIPLSSYPAIRTKRMDEFDHQLRAVYGATGFIVDAPADLDVCGNFLQLNDIALGFGTCGTAATIRFAESDFARLQLPLRGQGFTRSGRYSVDIGPGGASLTSPGIPSLLGYGTGFEQLFLRVSSEALKRRLTLLIDAPVRRSIVFETGSFASPALLAGLRRLLLSLVQQLGDPTSLLSPLAVQEIGQALIVQLLLASRHDFSAMLQSEPREIAASQVRRAEAYIEANWNRPIVIEDLVEAAGISARSLFRGFEKQHGCPPMTFVKHVRLRHARELLSRADGATTVTGVALACGFSNLGHFASSYRASFGELPSETLRRAR